MKNLELSTYNKEIGKVNQEDQKFNASSSFERLGSFYELADKALSNLAGECSYSETEEELQEKLLDDKSLLIRLATQTKCRTPRDVFEKVDFLSQVYLSEKNIDDYSLEDLLLKSLQEDCQALALGLVEDFEPQEYKSA